MTNKIFSTSECDTGWLDEASFDAQPKHELNRTANNTRVVSKDAIFGLGVDLQRKETVRQDQSPSRARKR